MSAVRTKMPHEMRASKMARDQDPLPDVPEPKQEPEPISEDDFVKFRHLISTLPLVNQVLESDVMLVDVVGNERHPKTVMARELCVFLMHYAGGLSYYDIKREMNKPCHSTHIAQNERLIRCWVKSMTVDDLKSLMQRRAMVP